MSRRLRQEAGTDLSPSQVAALATIERHGPLSPSELADRERIKRPTATRVVRILQSARLIERVQDPDDGRASILSITAEGRALLRRLRARKTAYLAKRLYRRGYNRMATGGDLRRRYGSVWLDRVMNFLVGYLDPKTRLLIVKDFRTFRREPAQVGQLFLFAFLLLLCVLNSRQFYEADIPVLHQHVVSLLNLCATGLLMCAYLARFIYPLISLEGRKFWVLGLLPLHREQLLWGKFAFAVTGTFVFGAGMVLLSDAVLGMPAGGMLLHVLVVCALVLGLSGLSVGLSAWMPNFRETDPSKIVVGFGGTINMVVSLLFLVLIVCVMALPYHFATTAESFVQTGRGFPAWLFAGLGVGVVVTGLAIWLPMRLGIRTLRHMEF